jgi:hypothetical protein
MSAGFLWSKEFVEQLSDKELRDAYVADQVRTRVALLIRALREQSDRDWSQTELGRRAGKPPNVISRLEDPDYGRMSVETLLTLAAAYDLPLWIDMPEWEDWFSRMADMSARSMHRQSFSEQRLVEIADRRRSAKSGAAAAYENQFPKMFAQVQQVFAWQEEMSGLFKNMAANSNEDIASLSGAAKTSAGFNGLLAPQGSRSGPAQGAASAA